MPEPAKDERSSWWTSSRTLFPVLAKTGSARPAGSGLGARTPNEATWRAPTPEVSPNGELGAVLVTIVLAWATALLLVMVLL